MRHETPLRYLWAVVVIGWLIVVLYILLAFPPATSGTPAYPTVIAPPVMWTATPPAHAVYAPSIERGN